MLTVADTAYAIAAVRAEEGEKPEPLFDDPYAARFAAAGAHAAEGTNRYLGLPFFREGIRLRTRFIDDAVRSALAAGLRQVVLLGAGFDARGLRMPEIPAAGARVFEIDVPLQMDRKRAIVGALPEHVVYVPFDFDRASIETDLPGALASAGFVARAGAVFVWEGVIGYIDRATIDASLRFMARAGGPGSRVVFTFAEGTFAPEGPDAALRAVGFARFEGAALDEVWRRHFPGEPPEGFGISRVGVARVE